MGSSIRTTFAVLLFFFIAGCGSNISEPENTFSETGPPTDSLRESSIEQLDSLLQKYPKRYDVPIEYARRMNVLLNRRVYELLDTVSTDSISRRLFEMRKKHASAMSDNIGVSSGPYPVFGILDGLDDTTIERLAQQSQHYAKLKSALPESDAQLNKCLLAMQMLSEITAGQIGDRGSFENKYALHVSQLNGLQTDSLFDIAYDPLDGSLYISSLKTNQVFRGIRFDSFEWDFTPFTVPHSNGMSVPQGLLVDNQRRILWVLSTKPDLLFGYSLVSGKPLFRIELSPKDTDAGFNSLCLVQDSLLYITAYNEGRVYKYTISDMPGKLELLAANIRYPRAITYLPADGRIYIASNIDGLYVMKPGSQDVEQVKWRRPVADAGLRKLHVLSRGVLLGIHDAFGPDRAVRYLVDSLGTVVQWIHPGRIEYSRSAVYLSSDNHEDTVFSLMKYEKTMTYSDNDSLVPGLPGIQVNVAMPPRVKPVLPLRN